MFVTIFFSYVKELKNTYKKNIKELKNKASQNHMDIGKEDWFEKLIGTAT